MIYLMLPTFHSAIHCCILAGFSFVKPVFIGNNDPKLRSKSRSKTKSWWKIIFVIEHVESVEEERAPEDHELPAENSPPLATSLAGEYIVWCCVCVCVDCI
jgi:hypothetical protein